MAFRFRKSKALGSGARLNFGKRSASLRVGGRGFGLTTGTSGERITAGLPGTGLSYSKKIGSGRHSGGLGSTLIGGFVMLVLIVALFRWMFGLH